MPRLSCSWQQQKKPASCSWQKDILAVVGILTPYRAYNIRIVLVCCYSALMLGVHLADYVAVQFEAIFKLS